MKKFFSVILVAILVICSVVAFAGCSKNDDANYELVLITDGATIDDGAYNRNAWSGVKEFGDANDMSYRYYQPSIDENGEVSTETMDNYIKLAVDGGAKYIVLQGEKMAPLVSELAPQYSEVNFLLVEGVLDTPISNVMTISFDELEAGYLAGYASVAMGNTKLGYIGLASEAKSADYGAGYVQGASLAADESGTPVVCQYANFDAQDLNFDYSFTIRPVYQKVANEKEETFIVNVVDGLGSGIYTDGENVAVMASPAPEGKTFDHWEVKSDTKGVSDKKVNINSSKKSTINLLVGDCDCTITAVWRDVNTVPVTVMNEDGQTVNTVYNVEENTSAWITAPAASSGMIFDHWETSDIELENAKDAGIDISVADKGITLTPVYVKSDMPTFDVIVENGTGSGSYRTGDYIEIIADAPEEGYRFYKWENIDNQGLSTGISMENEYCYNTHFEMVDRFSAIAESMYDKGTQVIFDGGNKLYDSIFGATWKISHQVYCFGAGVDQSSNGNCLSSVVNDYRIAINEALSNYQGGTNFEGTCKNNCLYVTGISNVPTYTDDDGNEIENAEYNDGYSKVYEGLSSGTISPKSSNGDIRNIGNSKCLTVNYWVN